MIEHLAELEQIAAQPVEQHLHHHLGDHRIELEQLPQMHGDAGPGLELFAIFRLQQTNRQVLEALPAGTPGAP